MLLPSNTNNNPKDAMWTVQNRLDLVLPAIWLAAQEKKIEKLSSSYYPTFNEILPEWSIRVEAADTNCSSTLSGLESVRLRCSTGSISIVIMNSRVLKN